MRLSKSGLLLHLALLLAVAGGVLTWLSGSRGYVVLSPGIPATGYVSDGGSECAFPFTLTLDSFVVAHDPGAEVPRDYISHLRIDGECVTVSVNNIVERRGYRLCQSSYDDSGRSVLSVNHDPWGIGFTYTGYLLFALAFPLVMLSRRGGFRNTLRRIGTVILLATGCGSAGNAAAIAGIPRERADSLAARQVVYNGRLMTFNSLARDFTAKVTGRPSYRGLTAEQVTASWLLYPEEWRHEPAILIKDKRLQSLLGLDSERASLDDLFDDDSAYRLQRLYGKGDAALDRKIEEADERVALVMQLLGGELIVAPPPSLAPLPATRVKAELLYNRLPFLPTAFITLFTGAFAAFAGLWGHRFLHVAALTALYAGLGLMLAAYLLQWYLSGHIPMSNTCETMEFLCIALLVLIAFIHAINRLLLPVGLLLAGSVALVCRIIMTNPVMTPLMPVLASPWLSIHVTLVMTSYALFAITLVNSGIALWAKDTGERMMLLNRALLYPALYLLGLGIITGAVWANVSWGRYWAWDPKETWALVTFIVYAAPMHRSLPLLGRPRRYHIYTVTAFLTVLMTYFGVNSLSSLHAYS